jgi:hypothetical protein
METRKSVFSLKNVSGLAAAMFIFLASCQKDNSILNSTDTQNVNAESASSAYLSEGSDVSTSAIGGMSATQYTGGRADGTISGLADRDDRLKCAVVTLTFTGTISNPSGKITITFDPTCVDKRGVKRSGTIVINFSGKRWMAGSYFSIHTDFFRNDVHIQGVDSVVTKLDESTNLGYLQFESILTGGKVTFGDGKTITREHNITREWFRASLPVNDEWHTLKGGQATGQCKNGNTYQMLITKDLVHKVSCLADKVFIPVSGTKVITVTTPSSTVQYTVDYGDGSCDNDVTVTINGKIKTITVNGEGN